MWFPQKCGFRKNKCELPQKWSRLRHVLGGEIEGGFWGVSGFTTLGQTQVP
jgi:hypothetical protein